MTDGINTYPEMNEKIVGILRINPEDKSGMYAAARIEELQSALAASKKREEELADMQSFYKAELEHRKDQLAAKDARIKELQEENINLIKEMGEGFRAIEIPLRKCIEAKDAEIAGLRVALEGMVNQFEYIDGGKRHTGGLSALETAFDVLGWDDPSPAPDFLLCQFEGCREESACGTPTALGYKRLCGKHFQALSPTPGEKKACGCDKDVRNPFCTHPLHGSGDKENK